MRGAQEPYRYEREVEEFLRWSPHEDRAPARGAAAEEPPPPATWSSRLVAAEQRALAAELAAGKAVERVRRRSSGGLRPRSRPAAEGEGGAARR